MIEYQVANIHAMRGVGRDGYRTDSDRHHADRWRCACA